MNEVKNKGITYSIITLLFVALGYLGYKGYQNYQRNEALRKEQTIPYYANPSSSFKKPTYSDKEYTFNKSLLDSIANIKDSVIQDFLYQTKDKIIFSASDKDTLSIKKISSTKYSHTSTLDLGFYDKQYNELLVQSLKPFMKMYNIDELEVYSITPTRHTDIPPPPGALTNFNYEEE